MREIRITAPLPRSGILMSVSPFRRLVDLLMCFCGVSKRAGTRCCPIANGVAPARYSAARGQANSQQDFERDGLAVDFCGLEYPNGLAPRSAAHQLTFRTLLDGHLLQLAGGVHKADPPIELGDEPHAPRDFYLLNPPGPWAQQVPACSATFKPNAAKGQGG